MSRSLHAPIVYWQPEDRAFWSREGARVARRNLLVSIPALMLSFAVWTVWSVVVVMLPRAGFAFSTEQLFWLAAAPGLAGGTLRLFFSFAVPIFGGRRWTTVSTLLLLVPVLGLAFAVRDTATQYPTFLFFALSAGVGGGNFASNMANVSFFFPRERQGTVLGLNAGLGNLGITLAQVVVPLAATGAILEGFTGTRIEATATPGLVLQQAAYVWVPAILIVAALAWRYMDDLPGIEDTAAEQAVVFVRRDTWILAWLYLGTFGSLIGFAASFSLVTETQFRDVDAVSFAFAGPLAAALARPLGGWLADRIGGAQVALATFVLMAASVAALLAAPITLGTYLALFAVLFVASGAGNGAVFQLIPAVFEERARAGAASDGALQAAAALGLASSIAAFGGFFIPKAYGTAVALTGELRPALVPFLVFYLSCIAATAWFYLPRGRADAPGFRKANRSFR